jgi:peroxin-5
MNAGNAYAWRMLGTAHAENDDDKQAIAAMAKALAADPNNPDVLLALGVSHVNELHEGEAVKYLMRCVTNNRGELVAPILCCVKRISIRMYLQVTLATTKY